MHNSQLLIFFVRHSERMDDPGAELTDTDKSISYPRCDCPITQAGAQLSFEVGQQAREFVDANFKKPYDLEFISSPFIRTLQTAAHFQYGFTGKVDTELTINTSIVALINKKAQPVF